MELRHLRYFVAVAREENVSRAALKLHVSQPALSRQIRDLEEEIGVILLKRGAKSVRLTEAGRLFLTEAQAVLTRAEQAVVAARAVASGENGELNIGYAPMPTVSFLPAGLRTFRKECGSMRVRMHDLSPKEMLEGLHEGTIDLAFTVRPTKAMLRNLRFEEFCRDRMCLAVGKTHPLARARSVSLEQIQKEPLVTYTRSEYPEYHHYLQIMFGGSKASPHITEEHGDGVAIVTSLETGACVAILPKSLKFTTGARIKLIPIIPAPPPLVIGALWVPSNVSEPVERFLEIMRRTMRSGTT